MPEIRQNICVVGKPKNPYAVACGQRLRVARLALDENNLRRFAEKTHVTEDALSAWERGINLVPPGYVEALRIRYAITHDYIYAGDQSRLPPSIAAQAPWPA